MTIDKQQDGNYKITDGKVFKDLQPINVMDYVRSFLIGDSTDLRTLAIQDIHISDISNRRAEYDTRLRIREEGRVR